MVNLILNYYFLLNKAQKYYKLNPDHYSYKYISYVGPVLGFLTYELNLTHLISESRGFFQICQYICRGQFFYKV